MVSVAYSGIDGGGYFVCVLDMKNMLNFLLQFFLFDISLKLSSELLLLLGRMLFTILFLFV